MTLIRENLRASTEYGVTTDRARYSVPRGMLSYKPDGQPLTYNGVSIDSMLVLDLRDELRTRCIDGMKQWVRNRKLKGMELLTTESGVKVYGPYRSRAGTYGTGGKQGVAVTGYGEDEDFNDELADFVFEAVFLTTRHRPLQTKAEA